MSTHMHNLQSCKNEKYKKLYTHIPNELYEHIKLRKRYNKTSPIR